MKQRLRREVHHRLSAWVATLCLCALTLAFAPACQSPGAELRPVAELPESYRVTWEAWLAADPNWEARRERIRVDPGLRRFLIDNLIIQLVRSYDRAELSNVERVGRFDRARAELLQWKSDAAPVLVELLAVADGVVGPLVGGLLVETGREALAPALELLERRELLARMRGATLIGKLPHGLKDEAHIQSELARLAAGDESAVVRGKAVEALARRGARDRDTSFAGGKLVDALRDADSLVAREAALGLARLADPRAVPALIAYLERCRLAGDVVGLEAAVDGLRTLTGADFRSDARAWQRWWGEQQGAAR